MEANRIKGDYDVFLKDSVGAVDDDEDDDGFM